MDAESAAKLQAIGAAEFRRLEIVPWSACDCGRMVLPGDCYVTIGIDVFDPAVAPGTGTPEPGGLSYDEMKALLAALAGRRDIRIRGFDLVEVNPLFDHNGTTALLASRVILDFLGMISADEEGPL